MVGLAWPGRGQGCVTNLSQGWSQSGQQGSHHHQPRAGAGPGQYRDARPDSPVSGPGSHRPQETPVPSESEPGPGPGERHGTLRSGVRSSVTSGEGAREDYTVTPKTL